MFGRRAKNRFAERSSSSGRLDYVFGGARLDAHELMRECHLGMHASTVHGRRIQQCFKMIRDYVRRTVTILEILHKKKAIEWTEYFECQKPNESGQCAEELLNVLLTKDVGAYQCFLDALDSTNQHHLRLLLEQKDYKLNFDHARKIRNKFTYLRARILTAGGSFLLQNLHRLDILDRQEYDTIKSKRTEDEMNVELLNLIIRSTPQQYEQFLECLIKDDQGDVVTDLLAGHTDAFKATSFVEKDETKLEAVIPSNGSKIAGITVVGSELFVIRSWYPPMGVDVYEANDLGFVKNGFGQLFVDIQRRIKISSSESHEGLVGCSHNNCVYVNDSAQGIVYRIQLPSDDISEWFTGQGCTGLSVTRSYSVLATFRENRIIREFESDGNLIREILLDSSIFNPIHCVELSMGQFVICHQGTRPSERNESSYVTDSQGIRTFIGSAFEGEERVCIVDSKGSIVISHGGPQGSADHLLNSPSYLAVDEHDNILVADKYNRRIKVFRPALTLVRHVVVQPMNHPYTLHLDEANRRLYIGEENGGRIFILRAS